jgi:hypothetical protein
MWCDSIVDNRPSSRQVFWESRWRLLSVVFRSIVLVPRPLAEVVLAAESSSWLRKREGELVDVIEALNRHWKEADCLIIVFSTVVDAY